MNVRLRRLALLISTAFASSFSLAGEQFNPAFLHTFGGQVQVDVSQFERATLPPGSYPFDIVINGRHTSSQVIELVPHNGDVVPCLRRTNLSDLAPLLADESSGCIDLPSVVRGTEVNVDLLQQRIEITLPQRVLNQLKRTTLRQSWDDGVSVLLANYNINTNQSANTHDVAIDTQLGMNIGAWRARSALAWADNNHSGSTGQSLQYLYAFRAIPSMNAQIQIGNTQSVGNMLGSTALYGVRIATDADMQPTESVGLTPRIIGIAQGNATVTISQAGRLLYTKSVPNGPFEITDLPVLLGNQDLLVRIQQADGHVEEFIQSLAVLPSMRPAGQGQYSLAAGRSTQSTAFMFVQGTASYGLTDTTTGNAEFALANNYAALSAGIARDLGAAGALSFDAAVSQINGGQGTQHGASIRALWAKSLAATGTNLQLVGARHASRGYYDIDAAEQLLHPDISSFNLHDRDTLQAQLSQTVGKGSINLNLTRKTSWDTSVVQQTVAAGYGFSWKKSRLAFSFSANRTTLTPLDRMWSVEWQIPLGSSNTRSNASLRWQNDNLRGTSQQESLNGVIGNEEPWRYALSATEGSARTLSAYADRETSIAHLSAGVSETNGHSQFSAGVSGGLAVHAGGVTLGQTLGETAALIDAGVPGVGIYGENDLKTDSHGYVLIPHLTAFRENPILIDPGSSDGLQGDFSDTSKTSVPSRGAVVHIKFDGVAGRPVLFNLKDKDGATLPLGTRLELPGGREGWVGPSGLAYVITSDLQGDMTAHWADKTCRIPYRITDSTTLQRQDAHCE